MPTEKQRREAERRRLQRQLERRAQREARRRRFAVIASVVGTLLIIGVIITVVVATSDDSSTPAAGPTGPTASVATTPAGSYPCTWTPTGSPAKQVNPPATTTPPKTGKVNILVSTSQGPMTFQLDRALAPCTVESFASLAEQRYYDQTSCHRLTSGQLNVLQCGDPLGNGSGGPGYTIPEELHGTEKYTRGVIAMARSQSPHSGGSQFFIVYKDSTLGPQYTIFGKVTTGMKVVDKVAAKGSTPPGDGKPNLPIMLTSVGVVE
jgi:peptidyl-prolyl cis-trans isomerase B (cyclophilin B)